MQSLPIITPGCASAAAAEPSPADSTKAAYTLVTLGCPKNLVDSERMAGLLRLEGYRFVREPLQADFVIVNTCGFIAAAREESTAAIREMEQLKAQGRLQGIIVAGCLAERDKELLLERHPGVDHLVGVFGRDDITKVADRLVGRLHEQRTVFRPAPSRALPDTQRLRITPPHLAFLKISEGCNRLCSFCAIPKMRGRFASKPLDSVIAEAEELAADGVRELVVVAQDTTFYGIDSHGRPMLAELLKRLDDVAGIEWIRLMYFYPRNISEELLATIAAGRKIVPYLDMPLQHVNDEVLLRMRRRTTKVRIEELIAQLRAAIPNLVLRTTFITGFPGETKAQFQELVEFVRQQRFERLGVFPYSAEPGTPAAEMDGQLPEKTRQTRRDRLLAVQQEIAFAWNKARQGQRLDVIIDAAVPDQPGAFIGRSYADAPEVDGVVYVTGEGLRPGQIVACEIVAAQGYDLVGVALDAPR